MQAGKLNERISILRPAKAQNAFGETIASESDSAGAVDEIEVWASIRQQGSAEKQRNGITTTDDTFSIRIRFRGDIDTTQIITYRGRQLAIQSVMLGGRRNREYLDIFATEAA